MNRALGYIGLLAVLLPVSACDQLKETPKETLQAPTPAVSQAPTVINPQLVDLVDGTLRRSSGFKMSGDLRPIWIVSGRIENFSPVELKSVSIKIEMGSKSPPKIVDDAVLVVDTDILPGDIGSFSRDIQLLPPDTAWEWSWSVIKAVPK